MISENDLIARHFAPIAGEGGLRLRDDAALARLPPGRELVMTKDMLVAGVHFFADDPPASIARKALRVNLSDLAAKGAEPLGFLLGLGLDARVDDDWMSSFVDGLRDDSATYGCPLLGGDTVRSPGGLTLSVTALGSVPAGRMTPRGGGRGGMSLCVTGTIGDAAIGLKIRLEPDAAWARALSPGSRANLLERYLHPQPRNRLARAVRDHAKAAMDVSDGLAGDAAKLAAAPADPSDRCRPVIEAGRVPLSDAAREAIALKPDLLVTALTGGDDYELLIAADADGLAALQAAGHAAGVPVASIGWLEAGEGATQVLAADGQAMRLGSLAFEHRFDA